MIRYIIELQQEVEPTTLFTTRMTIKWLVSALPHVSTAAGILAYTNADLHREYLAFLRRTLPPPDAPQVN
jgi:hypothetical protein